ncbi:MAG: addiction module toxin, HicA family [Bacteroidetes bacterium]|nr:MAG: addiction module toxin, HicA family [Bacteroidota bacterium]
MPKLPVLTAKEAEKMLLNSGFILLRSKGSHRIYFRNEERFVIPFHSNKSLHPKIVKSVLEAVSQDN